MPPPFLRLKTRAEFLAAAKGPSCARGAVVVQMRPRPGRAEMALGVTATKKVGGAVQRNRAKRRLREAARQCLPLHGRPSHDYVFVARPGAVSRPWARLVEDVNAALSSLAAGRADPARPPRSDARKRRPATGPGKPLGSGESDHG